jgi:hypothetical protein
MNTWHLQLRVCLDKSARKFWGSLELCLQIEVQTASPFTRQEAYTVHSGSVCLPDTGLGGWGGRTAYQNGEPKQSVALLSTRGWSLAQSGRGPAKEHGGASQEVSLCGEFLVRRVPSETACVCPCPCASHVFPSLSCPYKAGWSTQIIHMPYDFLQSYVTSCLMPIYLFQHFVF